MVDQRAGEVALRALGEHRRLRLHLGAGLEGRQRLALAAAALVAGADAVHRAVATSSRCASVSGSTITPSSSARSAS